MRALSIAALMALSSLAGLTYAQGASQRKETEITQPTPIILERPLGRPLDTERTTCFLPDDSGYPLNTSTTYDGQSYRCVEVFAPPEFATIQSDASGKQSIVRSAGTLTVRMAGWVKQGDTAKTSSSLELQLQAMEKRLNPSHPDRRNLERRVAEERRLRQSLRCISPDGGTHTVSAVIEDTGRRYQCVETYDQQLNLAGASWTPANQK